MIKSTHDADDTSLAGGVLRGPSKVARLETEGTVLEVPAANTDRVDALGADTRLCALATELELALLAVVGALGTSR